MNIKRTIKNIEKADRAEVDAIFGAALTRKMDLYPDWEIIYLALRRDNKEQRQNTVRAVLETILAEEERP